jgi:hypothetical protein
MHVIGSTELKLIVSGAGPGKSLRAGAVISVEVLERLGPEVFRVSAGGLVMKASALAHLKPGSVFSARVERTETGFILRALPERGNSVQTLILRSGLSDDTYTRLALAALLREGLAPEARALGRVRRAGSLAEGGQEGEASDRRSIAARLEAKGIAAEDAFVDAISSQGGAGQDAHSGSGEGEGEGEGRGREGREGERDDALGRESRDDTSLGEERLERVDERLEDRARLPQALDLEKDFERSYSPARLPSALASLLRALSMRSGEGGDLLSLFNHLRGPEGSWIHLPFAFDLDSIAFAGSFRIKLPYVPGGPGRMEARFAASRRGEEGKRDWSLALRFGGFQRPALRIAVDDEKSFSAAGRLLLSLEEELSAFECSVSLADPYEEAEVGGLDVDA